MALALAFLGIAGITENITVRLIAQQLMVVPVSTSTAQPVCASLNSLGIHRLAHAISTVA